MRCWAGYLNDKLVQMYSYSCFQLARRRVEKSPTTKVPLALRIMVAGLAQLSSLNLNAWLGLMGSCETWRRVGGWLLWQTGCSLQLIWKISRQINRKDCISKYPQFIIQLGIGDDQNENGDQLDLALLYLLQSPLIGSSSCSPSSSCIASSLPVLICLYASEIISSSSFLRRFHLILVLSHSSIFCRYPSSSFWQLPIYSSSYFSLDYCSYSYRCNDSFCVFSFLPSSTMLSTPSPILSICFSRLWASSFSATAASNCALSASSSSWWRVRVDWMRKRRNSERSAEFFFSICSRDSQLQMVSSISSQRERAWCSSCWELRDWLWGLSWFYRILLWLYSQLI